MNSFLFSCTLYYWTGVLNLLYSRTSGGHPKAKFDLMDLEVGTMIE